MPIDWNSLSLETMTEELVDEIRQAHEDLLTEKKAIVANKATILNDLKNLKKQYAEVETLIGEAEVGNLDELRSLVVKGKAASDPANDVNKTLQQEREQRIADGIAHRKALEQAKIDADASRSEMLAQKESLNGKYRQSIIRTKLQQEMSPDFIMPNDGIIGLQNLGYSIDLEEDASEEDNRAFEDRGIVLYKAGKSIPFTLKDGIEEVKREYPHYLRSTFAGGSGHNNRKGGADVENPWVTGNRTQQLLMMQSDPTRAQSLKQAAKK